MNHAVVIAGGSGTRFWPLSREQRPKQFLAIGDPQPMLRGTVERLLPLFDWNGVLVVAAQHHGQIIRDILPELSEQNLLLEPVARNTAAAIGLAAIQIQSRDPEGVMIVLPSDHIIQPVTRLRKVLKAACSEAKGGCLITLGMVPTRPETGYGYIHAGRELRKIGESLSVFEVLGFEEKPDYVQAHEYLKAGSYYWNSGIFAFRVESILSAFSAHMPKLHEGLLEIQKASAQERPGVVRGVFEKLESVSIDYGVMEKAANIHMLPCDFSWSDVGSWAALPDVIARDESGNVLQGDVLAIDTHSCVIYSEKRLVACIGLQNMVVVETPDAILVCPLSEAQRVRSVVEELTSKNRKNLL